MKKMKSLLAFSFIAVSFIIPLIYLFVTTVKFKLSDDFVVVSENSQYWEDVVGILGEQVASSRKMPKVFDEILLSMIISISLGLPLGIYVSRLLSKPLQNLNNEIKAMTSSQVIKPLNIKGPVEIAELADSFNKLTAELEKKDRLTRNLVADVSHELMTPLTVLEGNLRAIIDDVYDLDKDEIGHLYERTTHMIRLVKDLRELTNAEIGNINLKGEVTEVTRMVRKLAESYSTICDDHGITIEAEVPSYLINCWIDRKRFFQVMDNLIGNAIRYTPEGGKISLNVELIGDTAIISVIDTGVGISKDKLTAIFRRLYRINPDERSDLGHSGLGLAISRAIIEKMNGSIFAKSEGEGMGTTFSIMLPAVFDEFE
ncbi:MAG: HAMP domain-containing protein [Spirochaetales bacterium]|nr:HAMP domain-containing protein [Spirochaetales bacterium]